MLTYKYDLLINRNGLIYRKAKTSYIPDDDDDDDDCSFTLSPQSLRKAMMDPQYMKLPLQLPPVLPLHKKKYITDLLSIQEKIKI